MQACHCADCVESWIAEGPKLCSASICNHTLLQGHLVDDIFSFGVCRIWQQRAEGKIYRFHGLDQKIETGLELRNNLVHGLRY